MKIEALKYFIATAESRSINEAAQKLYIAQPSLTKSLQLLEKELDLQLFVRSKSGISLTNEGKQILPEAKQIVKYYEGWKNLSCKPMLQSLDVYISFSFSGFLMSDVLFSIQKNHPELNIVNFREVSNPELYISPELHKPVLSIFPCQEGLDLSKWIHKQGNPPIPLFSGEYMCLLNKNNPLAAKDTISLADLKGLYLSSPDLRQKRDFDWHIPSSQKILDVIPDNHVALSQSVNSVINMVRKHSETFAISYYPALLRYPGVENGELVYRPFRDVDTKSTVYLFYSRQAAQYYPLLKEIIEDIRQAYKTFFHAYGIGMSI